VLFLDEPTTGLDPVSRMGLWDVVHELVADGTTVLLTTQYLEEAEQLADQVAVLIGGRIAASGTVEDLKRRLGPEMLTVRLTGPGRPELGDLASVLDLLADADARLDPTGMVLTVASADAAAMVAPVVRRLDAAGIRIAGLEVNRPTLDDVFVALTAPTAGSASAASSAAGSVPAAASSATVRKAA